jgi:WD40 repeat protein
VPGRPEESELIARIVSSDESARMPQLDDPFAQSEIDLIRRWIADGARFDGRDQQRPFKSQSPSPAQPIPPESYRLPVPVLALALSPDGTEIATSGFHEVTIWNAESGKLVRRLQGLPERIPSIVYRRDGQHLVVASGVPGEHGELTEIDSATGELREVLARFDDVAMSAALSHDESLAVGTSADSSTVAIRMGDRSVAWESQLHSDWVTCAAFSFDDRFVATGNRRSVPLIFRPTLLLPD